MTGTRGSLLASTGEGSDFDSTSLDKAVDAVAAKAQAWIDTSIEQRIALLEGCISAMKVATPAWLDDACRAKGLRRGGAEEGEELFAGPILTMRMLRMLRDSLSQVQRRGRPRNAGPVQHASDDRLRIGVFPASLFDRVEFPGVRAEVYIEPGITLDQIHAEQAWGYRDPSARVELVLCAGNVASLGPRDILYKLFVENAVVLAKSNPVNEYLVSHWRVVFAPLIEHGVLAIVEGGPDAGRHLTHHPKIDAIHITGSDKTHDAIVFGSGAPGAARKAANTPELDKPVSCELGNVSPVIIVPGRWTKTQLNYQAEHIATMLVNNAGFNCLTSRVLITHAQWPQRDEFLAAVGQVLSRVATRNSYYPGARDRWQRFVDGHPDAQFFGDKDVEKLPWTFITGVDPTKVDDDCFTVEAFCSLFAETALPAASAAEFVDAATDFANDVVWGTLSATLIADPAAMRDEPTKSAIRRSIDNLRFGGIGVNIWHGTVFALTSTTWGAYPGHPVNDIQSGTGVVGNTNMLTHTQKSVAYGPFMSRPKPPWFAEVDGTLPLFQKVLAYEAGPTWGQVPGLLLAALRA